MIDIKLLEDNFEVTSKRFEKKHVKREVLESIYIDSLALKEAKADLEALKARRKTLSKQYAQENRNL